MICTFIHLRIRADARKSLRKSKIGFVLSNSCGTKRRNSTSIKDIKKTDQSHALS